METQQWVTEPSRRIPVHGEYDVVVVGGGPAGIAAAASAARFGASTIIVERYGFLGGMGTAAGVSGFCGLYANVYGEHKRVVYGVVDELFDRLKKLDGLSDPHPTLRGRVLAQTYDPNLYKIAADELLGDYGATILYHAFAAGVIMKDETTIDSLIVETKSGRFAIRGQVFIDASGDGDVAAWAGAPYTKGDGQGNMWHVTMMFRVGEIDPEKAIEGEAAMEELMEKAAQKGWRFSRRNPIVRPQTRLTEWRANIIQVRHPDGRPIDGTSVWDLTWAEIEGRRQVVDMVKFLREWVPGFERAEIVDIPPQIGLRETRRVHGEYELTADDVLECRDFEDTIGVNGWPLEAHESGRVAVRWQEARGYNQLPYRIILPQRIDNLLMAGRCASMTHEAQAAARVSGPCFVMGQAAGTAAALSRKDGVSPKQLDVRKLQTQLERDGAYLGTKEL